MSLLVLILTLNVLCCIIEFVFFTLTTAFMLLFFLPMHFICYLAHICFTNQVVFKNTNVHCTSAIMLCLRVGGGEVV